MGQGNAPARSVAEDALMLRKKPGWASEADWADYKDPGAKKANGPSEDKLALRMAEVHAGSLIHATLLAKWFRLCKQGWQAEKTPVAFDLARNACRAEAVTNVSSKLVAGVLKMCAADPRIAVPPEIFDADPWIFNTMTGTVELKIGKLRPHRPDDYCTKWASVGPGGECPMFHDFMRTIFAKDIDLIAFLQRFFGYVLTGLTEEHAMLFFYGTGKNGKSVLLSTTSGILRNYHKVAPMDTFTVTGATQHPTDLAGLMGARLVTAVETEEGRRWAEAKIKALTGAIGAGSKS
jgi:putative DNA primase/helicase